MDKEEIIGIGRSGNLVYMLVFLAFIDGHPIFSKNRQKKLAV